MTEAATQTSATTKSSRSPTWRFSLRTAMLAITALAVVLGLATYYRSLPVRVTYQFVILDAAALQPFLARATPASSASYRRVVVSGGELADLLRQDGKPVPVFREKTRVISSWPKVAETCTYSHEHPVLFDAASGQMMMDWDSSTFGGFLGARRAGVQLQLRIEGDVTFRRPDDDAADRHEKCAGRIFYEGPLPDGAVVFFTPVGEDAFHAVIFAGEL